MRTHRLMTVCTLLFATQNLAAADQDYVTNVQQAYAPQAAVQRIAVVPLICPRELDCEDLEEDMVELLGKRTRLSVVPMEETRQMLERTGIRKLDYESRYILAEGLHVDAIASLDIQRAAVDLMEGKLTKIGNEEVREPPVKMKHVQIALQMAAKDGTTLLQAAGEAKVQSTFKSMDGIAMNTFEAMLEQAVPAE